jgi:hypothetical protein
MNQVRVNDRLCDISFHLNKADTDLDYLNDELAETPFAADRDTMAAKLKPLIKDVSALIQRIDHEERRQAETRTTYRGDWKGSE